MRKGGCVRAHLLGPANEPREGLQERKPGPPMAPWAPLSRPLNPASAGKWCQGSRASKRASAGLDELHGLKPQARLVLRSARCWFPVPLAMVLTAAQLHASSFWTHTSSLGVLSVVWARKALQWDAGPVWRWSSFSSGSFILITHSLIALFSLKYLLTVRLLTWGLLPHEKCLRWLMLFSCYKVQNIPAGVPWPLLQG